MKTKYWILILCALFVLFALLSILLLLPQERSGYAEIWSEGVRIKTVALQTDQRFTLESSHGSNTIEVKDGKIAVVQASCPDHICMDRGACNHGVDIICLPNRLVIHFPAALELDAAAG